MEFPPGTFNHRDHIEAAYEMLRKYPFLEATSRYASTIETMATNAGAFEKFNVTITLAFMALIAERMESGSFESFADFADQHPDLFAPDVLAPFYSPQRLRSPLARRIFMMPDAARSTG